VRFAEKNRACTSAISLMSEIAIERSDFAVAAVYDGIAIDVRIATIATVTIIYSTVNPGCLVPENIL